MRVIDATDGAAIRPTWPATSGRSASNTCSAALASAVGRPGVVDVEVRQRRRRRRGREVDAVAVEEVRAVRKSLTTNGIRSTMVIRSADGYSPLHPRAGHPADRRHPVGDLAGVDLQQRGVRAAPRAASMTSSRVTAPVPLTTMLRADIAGVK